MDIFIWILRIIPLCKSLKKIVYFFYRYFIFGKFVGKFRSDSLNDCISYQQWVLRCGIFYFHTPSKYSNVVNNTRESLRNLNMNQNTKLRILLSFLTIEALLIGLIYWLLEKFHYLRCIRIAFRQRKMNRLFTSIILCFVAITAMAQNYRWINQACRW